MILSGVYEDFGENEGQYRREYLEYLTLSHMSPQSVSLGLAMEYTNNISDSFKLCLFKIIHFILKTNPVSLVIINYLACHSLKSRVTVRQNAKVLNF